MTLDLYQFCPCGSGKKVKFCCSRDIVHELDRVLRMVQGEQRLAALEKLDALLAKYPQRPSLLMLKANIEMQLRDLPKAQATVQQLQQVAPQNASAQALLAIVLAAEAQPAQVLVRQLQQAFAVADSAITSRMYEAIILVSVRLAQEGFPAAALGHLRLAYAITDAKDDRCTSMLMQLSQSRAVPLLLREPLELTDCPDAVTWKKEFRAAMADAHRGCWLPAADKLRDMSRRILDAAPILQNLAVLRTWLAQNEEAVESFHALARIRELPLEDRVHFEALAQLLDTNSDATTVPVVEVAYPVTDTERLMEQCLSHRRVRSMPVPPRDAESDEPPAKAMFDVLDRPMPPSSADLTVDDVPRSLGTCAIYGRQTDREARLELITTKTAEFAPLLDVTRELLGGQLPEPVSEQELQRVSRVTFEILSGWRLPDDITPEQRQRLATELRRHAILQRWPQTPSPLLGGKTPIEAVREGQSKVPLLANLLILELTAQEGQWQIDTRPLREQLNLPVPAPIDPRQQDLQGLEHVPVHRFGRLVVSQLSDDQLLAAYRRAYGLLSVESLRQLALEVIQRPSLDERIDKVEAYDILSDVAQTTDEALEYLEKARKLATAEGESPAQWLIDELELRLLRGEGEKFLALLKEIQTRYINEIGVGPALMQLLTRYGLVSPDGHLRVPTRRDAAAAAEIRESQATAPPVWTPDAPAASPAGDEQPKESKLWLPGMD